MAISTPRRKRGTIAAAALAVIAIASLSACANSSSSSSSASVGSGVSPSAAATSSSSGGNNPLAPNGGSGTVVVGSANFSEDELLAEIYVLALQAKGVKVTP